MGSHGDQNIPKNVDFAPAQTQPFDSQLSPPSSPGAQVKGGDGDELRFLAEDAFETQVLNLTGETQVLNLAGDTQVLDDLDCDEIMGTQLLDEFDNEVAVDSEDGGTDRTEVLGDGDELSDDDSARRGSGHSLDGEKQVDALTNEHLSSGLHPSTATPAAECIPEPESGSVRFTSIRAASLRASGLAARNMALKGTSSESHSILTNSQFLEQHTVKNNETESKAGEEVDQVHDMGEHNEKGIRNGNKGRVGCSTVRKLFTEDSLDENERISYNGNNNVGGEDLLQLPIFDGEFTGLSYVDSQEPGESSQANALEFVDKFIKNTYVEFDHEVDHRKSTGGKSKHVSSAKGPQSLAKKANDRRAVGETGTFDWDDNREDEGGGDIFLRRKEEFLGSGSFGRRSFTNTQKPKKSRLDESRDNKEQPNVNDKIMVHSDSRLLLHKSKVNKKTVQEAEMKSRKNLANDFDEHFNVDSTREPFEANVGLDTQMAAEAMEALCNQEGITNHEANDAHLGVQSNSKGSPEGSPRGKTKNRVSSKQLSRQKRVCLSDKAVTRQSEKTKRIDAKLLKESSITSKKHSRGVRKECDTELVMTKSKRRKPNAEGCFNTNVSESMDKIPSKIIQQRKAELVLKGSRLDEFDMCHGIVKSSVCRSVKQHLPEKVGTSTPIARRTRQSMVVNQMEWVQNVPSEGGAEMNHQMEVGAVEENMISKSYGETSKRLNSEKESSKLGSSPSEKLENVKPNEREQLLSKLRARSNGIDALSYPRGRRSRQSLSGQVNGYDQEQSSEKPGAGDAAFTCDSANMNGKMIQRDSRAKAVEYSRMKSNAKSLPSAEHEEVRLDKTPREKCKPSDSACTTPTNFKTPVNDASPVCMGNEYLKQTCKRNLSKICLMKEISSLSATPQGCTPAFKDSRKRRDMANVRVLFSQHLDEDIIKQQKKILARLGSSIASSITHATHFITDQFVRTRNMLEAIASGKPVVTHLWLECVGQANYYIDEEAYILRDTKKEKEFGFSMPVSLARARQCPLLEGQRVLITPNTKPGKETISSLVKAVHGQAMERIGRSALKDDKVPNNLLVLSCEEDYAFCVPFLEKGAAVYSSELLLNGIVTQKLEYERHQLFVDHVKRTRSTIWLRKDGNEFVPVTKQK